MAKLHGAAKRAFLARMAKGRKKKHRGGGKKRRKSKRSRARRGLHKKHTHWGHVKAHNRRVNPRRKHRRKHRRTSKRRRNPIAYLVNPTGGHSMARRRKHRKHNPHRKHHRRHRRNPGGAIGGQIKGLAKLAIPALGAGFVGNFVEAKFLGAKSMAVRAIGRAAMAVGAGFLLKRNPGAAGAAMGALLGPIAGEQGTKMGGGLMLHSTTAPAAVKGLAEAVAGTEDMAALLQSELQGFGIVLQAGTSGIGDESGAELDAMNDGELLNGTDDA